MTKEPIMIDDVNVAECENLYTTNLPIGNYKIKILQKCEELC